MSNEHTSLGRDRLVASVAVILSLFVLALAVAQGGCSVAARTAQGALEPFQVYLLAPEGAPASTGLAAGVNARYLAVSGHARGRIEVWAPTHEGPALAWSADYDGAYQPHAWEIKLWQEGGAEWLQVLPASWDNARASLHRLPAHDRPMAAGTLLGPPARASAPVRLDL